MKAELEKKENSKATFTMEISEKDFDKAIQKAYLKNKGMFNIPGFRRGKAPRKLIEMSYGKEIFYEEALNIIFPKVYEEAIEELKLEVVDYPEIDIEEIEKGKPVSIKVEVTVKPEVELGDYKSIEIEKVEYNVTNEDVEKQLQSIQDANARIIDASDRETKEGDLLTIDYEGFIDGEPFEGGTAENQTIEIGEKKFIPGFEEQLVGKKKGDNVEVKVTFPEDYFEESLSGKEAIFKVTINDVKQKELPKLDDEFAIDVSEFDTLDELKKDIKEKLEEETKNKEKIEKEGKVIEKAVELSKVDIPEVMIDNQIENELRQFEYQLQMQGLNMEQYYQFSNTTEEDLRENIKPNAEIQVKTNLVLDEISKVEEIEVSDEEIDTELEKMAKEYNQEDIEKFIEDMKKGDLEHIKSGIVRDKTIEMLLDNAKFI